MNIFVANNNIVNILGIIRGIPRGLKNVTYVSYAWDRFSFFFVLEKSPQNTRKLHLFFRIPERIILLDK
jgi:hypothetical protein